MSRWDNAPIEYLFRNLETEWIPKMTYQNITEATMDIGWYLMTSYNKCKSHATNDELYPVEKEGNLNLYPVIIDH